MPTSTFQHVDSYRYLSGFNNFHETSAVADAVPVGSNSPQKPPFGLYAERLSGTSFTAPRHENQQTWLYRIIPASSHHPFTSVTNTEEIGNFIGARDRASAFDFGPKQLRFDPYQGNDEDSNGTDWLRGLEPIAGAGDPVMRTGLDIYVYAATKSMSKDTAFYSADGDFLIVPQQGDLDIRTELGYLMVRQGEFCVIPRGIRFNVGLLDASAKGYALELYQGHFSLPELGPIGSHGLANPADFQVPIAAYEERTEQAFTIFGKFSGQLYQAQQDHSCFDVVGWKGNYYPYKYDLGRFNTIGTISFDHPDPSIFTVLTAQSDHAGTAIADFVIFPPRWLVAEETFRPPYFHRNCMSEFMGMIKGEYDGKAGGFVPGGASLHSAFSGHGPDSETFMKASEAELKPVKVGQGSLAFMFESCLMLGVPYRALETMSVQNDYNEKSWIGLKPMFIDNKTHTKK